MDSLDQLFEEATLLLDKRNLRWALIGGLALAAYGAGRPTSDVDLVVEYEHQAEILDLFATSRFKLLHASRGYSNHLRGRDRVDLVYVGRSTAQKLFAGARVLQAGNRKVRVVRPEHLAAMKILAMKNDPARQVSELADLEQLLRLPEIDREAVQIQFERHGFQELFIRLTARL